MTSWKTYGLRVAIGGAVMMGSAFVGVRLAMGDPGGPPTRNALTFSGVLRNSDDSVTPGAHSLTFVFTKPGGGGTCSPPPVIANIGAGGAFSVEVPMSACPQFFDGADVTYTVSDDSGVLTPSPVSITPVPYARFADQAGVGNDCPVGYSRSAAATDAAFVVCVRRRTDGAVYDEVVKVGTGSSAFWIDRYESSVNENPLGLGTWRFLSAGDSGALPRTGQWSRGLSNPPAYALSIARLGVTPARAMTWFQAAEACRASGKRLPDGEEWLTAARGTIDPVTPHNGFVDADCNTSGGGPRSPGGGSDCRSGWGAQDMIGNLQEYTREWYAGTMTAESPARLAIMNWGVDFNGDSTFNVGGVANNGLGTFVTGLPAAPARGGTCASGTGAGIFALDLETSPGVSDAVTGFRCVIPR